MSKFCALFSSSSGNCSYLASGDTALLVDCGKNCKAILSAMASRELEPELIRGIFITHEHSDHISGLRVLAGKLGCPVYAPPPLLEYLERHADLKPGTRLIPVEEQGVAVGTCYVHAFHTPHDSIWSVGYQIHTCDERTVGIATDLGHLSQEVMEHITGCDLVMLESNYDKRLLQISSYPYLLKRRIAGPKGHLCNDDCAGILPQLVKQRTTRLILAHLSQENNSPEVARRTALQALTEEKLEEGLDFTLDIAQRYEASRVILI